MGVRTKTLVTVALVGVVIGVMSLSVTNNNLFKGQLLGDKKAEVGDSATDSENGPTLLPDLKIGLTLDVPEKLDEDLIANVEIMNTGEGAVESGQEFVYELEINGTQVLSNSDTYSALEKGDSFSFSYPVPKTIYQYADKGKVTASVDVGNAVKEADESNNKNTVSYEYLTKE